MKLSKIEMETVFLSNEKEADMEIYTYNDKQKRQLSALADKYPQLYRVREINSSGGGSFVFNKKLMSVKFKEPLDREKQALMDARMAKLRSKKAVK